MKTALITGATRGIGAATVRLAVERGYRVFATGRDEGRLARLAAELGVATAPADLADATQTAELWARAAAALGHVDVLVSNAGTSNQNRKVPIVDLEVDDLDQQWAVNVRAPMILSKAALRHMGGRGGGHIVHVVSTAALRTAENFAVYTATKHALRAFAACLTREARHLGVRVTAIFPGGTDTEIRPVPRPDYLRPESVAAVLLGALEAPPDAVVHELVVRPDVEDL